MHFFVVIKRRLNRAQIPILLTVIILITLVAMSKLMHTELMVAEFKSNNQPSPMLNPKFGVIQHIHLDGYLSTLSFQFGTYTEVLKGRLEVRFLDPDGKEIKSVFYPGEKIRNNLFTDIPIGAHFKRAWYGIQLYYQPKSRDEQLSVWLSQKISSRKRSARYQKANLYRSLVMRKYYRISLGEGIAVFWKRYRSFNKAVLFAIILLYMIISVFSIIYIFRKNVHGG